MARLIDDAQWIILLGFIISISIFFLALIINESVLVGQTTAESVLELPKSDIHDMRNEIFRSALISADQAHYNQILPSNSWIQDMREIGMNKKNAVITISVPTPILNSNPWQYPPPYTNYILHFDNGVTNYNEVFYY